MRELGGRGELEHELLQPFRVQKILRAPIAAFFPVFRERVLFGTPLTETGSDIDLSVTSRREV